MTIPAIADEKLRLVEKVIQGRDFTCMVETVNAVDAWLGSLPGHVYANVRQPPVSTLNLAHMIPLSAVWAGPAIGRAFQGAAAILCPDRGVDAVSLLAARRRCRPYAGGRTDRRRQVGAAGADGAAVPALSRRTDLCFRLWRLDPRRGAGHGRRLARSRRRLVRRRVGVRVALQPLARIDDAAERGWAADWIAAILARERISITPEVKDHLWSALTSLGLGAGRRAHADRPVRAAAVRRLEARAPTLLPGRPLWPVARCRSRAAWGRPRCRRSKPRG